MKCNGKIIVSVTGMHRYKKIYENLAQNIGSNIKNTANKYVLIYINTNNYIKAVASD